MSLSAVARQDNPGLSAPSGFIEWEWALAQARGAVIARWPILRGCSPESEGCDHCYAAAIAARFAGQPGGPFEGLATVDANGVAHWTGRVRFDEKHLLDPLSWKTPRVCFVNPTSDLYHRQVGDELLDRIFAVMALCPQHLFVILTKRPDRMRAWLAGDDLATGSRLRRIIGQALEIDPFRTLEVPAWSELQWPLANVWQGVSVEKPEHARRIQVLCETPAARRIVSFEPLLGHFSFEGRWLYHPDPCVNINLLERMDWIIAGGESGKRARPMHPDWARTLRDEASACEVPFFFKQWGEFVWLDHGTEEGTARWPDGHESRVLGPFDPNCYRVGKATAGRLLDGRTWDEVPA